RALVGLGVGDDCVRTGFAYRRTLVLGRNGQPLVAMEVDRLAGERFPGALGMARADLQRVLARAAESAGARFEWNAQALAVHLGRGPACIEFAGGRQAVADLVLLACGARAGLRASVFGAAPPAASGQAWLDLLVARPARLGEALQAGGPAGFKAHVLPLGATLAGLRLTGPAGAQAELVLATESVPQVLRTFPPQIAALLPVGDATARPAVREAVAGTLPLHWHRGPVLAVGGCAHDFSPQFGQHAAQAMEDALVLGELLAASNDPAAIGPAFERRRAARVLPLMAITDRAARWESTPDAATDLQALHSELGRLVAQAA
ncbi:MAG TPA: hypothetical protein VLK85_07510, partial [Ramlibacter sp.]|nr:hypothetical protein [Ramlibacter sp.]